MKFIIRYESVRVEREDFEVAVEADSAFDAELKVRDTAGSLADVPGVGRPRAVGSGPSKGPTSRRVMAVVRAE